MWVCWLQENVYWQPHILIFIFSIVNGMLAISYIFKLLMFFWLATGSFLVSWYAIFLDRVAIVPKTKTSGRGSKSKQLQ